MLLLHTCLHVGLAGASVPSCEQRANLRRRYFLFTWNTQIQVAMPPCKLSAQRLGSFTNVCLRSRFPRREMWRPLSSYACPSFRTLSC
jgi:hypothetical protein